MDLLLDRMTPCAIGINYAPRIVRQFWAATSQKNAMSEPTRTCFEYLHDYPSVDRSACAGDRPQKPRSPSHAKKRAVSATFSFFAA